MWICRGKPHKQRHIYYLVTIRQNYRSKKKKIDLYTRSVSEKGTRTKSSQTWLPTVGVTLNTQYVECRLVFHVASFVHRCRRGPYSSVSSGMISHMAGETGFIFLSYLPFTLIPNYARQSDQLQCPPSYQDRYEPSILYSVPIKTLNINNMHRTQRSCRLWQMIGELSSVGHGI